MEEPTEPPSVADQLGLQRISALQPHMHPCCRASAWILIALAADPAAALAASPRKGKATRPAGGGFGAAASKQTSLDAAAKRLLKEAGGDVPPALATGGTFGVVAERMKLL